MLHALWLPLLAAALAGPAPTPPVTTLRGHFDHAPAGDTVRVRQNEQELKMPLSASGDFQFEFKGLTQNLPVTFSYADQRTELYLMPGNQLTMRLDFSDFDKSLVFSGSGSEVNNYLAQAHYTYKYGPEGKLPRPEDHLDVTPADIRRLSDAFRQSRLAFLASYAQAHPLPADFQRDERLTIDVDWATTLLLYAYKHQPTAPDQALPESFYGFLREVPLPEASRHFGRSIIDNSLVANLVMGYQFRLAPAGHLSTDPAEGPRLYQTATAELGNTKARDWVMEALLFSNTRSNVPGARAFYATFRQHNRDSALARQFRQTLTQRHQHLEVGQPAPTFTLLDNAGQSVALSDFRGKVVYLDFWGTWCHPCMEEMTEFAPALKKQFEGCDVVFLCIAVGDPEAKWQKTLLDKQLTSPNSVHLRQSDKGQADVAADYQVNGYPSYYLIGRDGRMVQAYAPRPSDGAETVAAIEAALKR